MFYVLRGPDGSIEQVSKRPLPESECLEDSSPEMRAFWADAAHAPSFSTVDAEFVRVIEDLIDVLITKNIIMHTDLPVAAQQKLMFRKGLRSRLHKPLDLLDSDDMVI
jgi:hypothetical protein